MFYLLPNMYIKLKTKTKNNIVMFGMFHTNYIVILAFFETICLKYDYCLYKFNILVFRVFFSILVPNLNIQWIQHNILNGI